MSSSTASVASFTTSSTNSEDQLLRCFCRTAPLLAVVEQSKRRPALRIKSHRQGRVLAEVLVTSGVVHIRCKACDRWHRVLLDGRRVKVSPA